MITKRKENPYLNIYLIYSVEGQQEGGNIYNLEGHQGVGIYSIEIHHDGEMVLMVSRKGKIYNLEGYQAVEILKVFREGMYNLEGGEGTLYITYTYTHSLCLQLTFQGWGFW
jgi:hypothetical protein